MTHRRPKPPAPPWVELVRFLLMGILLFWLGFEAVKMLVTR